MISREKSEVHFNDRLYKKLPACALVGLLRNRDADLCTSQGILLSLYLYVCEVCLCVI